MPVLQQPPGNHLILLGWPKVLFGVFCALLWKNLNFLAEPIFSVILSCTDLAWRWSGHRGEQMQSNRRKQETRPRGPASLRYFCCSLSPGHRYLSDISPPLNAYLRVFHACSRHPTTQTLESLYYGLRTGPPSPKNSWTTHIPLMAYPLQMCSQYLPLPPSRVSHMTSLLILVMCFFRSSAFLPLFYYPLFLFLFLHFFLKWGIASKT